MNSGQYAAADLVVDFDAGLVSKDGQALTLPDLTWRTLCCLLERPGTIISIDDLIKSVWGDVTVSNETVTQRIKLLRRALGDDSQNPRYIETVRGRGFRFIATPAADDPSKQRTSLLAAVLAVLIVLVSVLLMTRENEPAGPADNTADRVVARGNEYLARVKGEDNQLAIELYEEALRREPEHLGALVGLSFASSHNASKFNMPLDWAAKAQALAEKAIALGAGSQAHHALGFAHDAQGQINAAITAYEKALELQPDNAAAISSVAYLYQRRGQLAKALVYGRRAHALNPDVAFSEVQIAGTLFLLGRDSEAHEWLNRGMMLKPDNVFIYSAKVRSLMARGQFGAALDTIEEASRRGIERPELLVFKGLVAVGQGRRPGAEKYFEAASNLEPSRETGGPYSLWLSLQNGETETKVNANDWINKHVDTPDHQPSLLAAGLMAAQGNKQAANDRLKQAVEKGFRDWRWLEHNPMFMSLQGTDGFQAVVGVIQAQVAAENAAVDGSR